MFSVVTITVADPNAKTVPEDSSKFEITRVNDHYCLCHHVAYTADQNGVFSLTPTRDSRTESLSFNTKYVYNPFSTTTRVSRCDRNFGVTYLASTYYRLIVILKNIIFYRLIESPHFDSSM